MSYRINKTMDFHKKAGKDRKSWIVSRRIRWNNKYRCNLSVITVIDSITDGKKAEETGKTDIIHLTGSDIDREHA